MTWKLKLLAILITSILCLSGRANLLLAVDDHRVVLKVDKKTTIAPAGTPKRGMMSMVRHPDATIYLNFQTRSPTLHRRNRPGTSSGRRCAWTVSPRSIHPTRAVKW